MQRLKRALIWLGRIRYCRGFGIQSPTDYSFVRYVINEHYPYYAFEDLNRSLNTLDAQTLRLCKLYFRLANYCQSPLFVDVCPASTAAAVYVKAACRKTVVDVVDDPHGYVVGNTDSPILVRCKCLEENAGLMDAVMEQVADGSLLVVEGIKEDTASKRLWCSLTEGKRVAAAYDLYDCGIIRIDKHRYTKKYIINF